MYCTDLPGYELIATFWLALLWVLCLSDNTPGLGVGVSQTDLACVPDAIPY